MIDIIKRCKCGVYLTINRHKNYYDTPEEWLIKEEIPQREIDDIGKEVWDEMIKRNNIITLQFYPRTPVCFYKIYHYDYDSIIEKAKKILDEENK